MGKQEVLAKLSAALVLPFLLVTVSCSDSSQVSLLSTDIPEMALYAEMYNGSQSTFRIMTQYSPFPQSETYQSTPPDLVVSKYLSPQGGRNTLSSLDYVFHRASQPYENFYPSLLEMGQDGGVQVLFPLSFNLPVVYGLKKSFPDDWAGLTVNLQEFQKVGQEFNRPNKIPPTLGFSLRWLSQQTEALFFQFHTSFQVSSGGILTWNEEAFQKALGYLKQSRDLNAGKFEDQFSSKYLPGHGFRLISENRVLFYPSDLKSYLNLPPSQSIEMEFRYPTVDNRIMACSDVVFLGIPRQAASKQAAEDFTSWIFRTQTQVDILESEKKRQIRTFGIASGLSSLKEVTERQIPAMDNRLVGLIPPANSLEFPPSLPAEWDHLFTEVINPWILDTLEGKASASLAEAHRLWNIERKH